MAKRKTKWGTISRIEYLNTPDHSMGSNVGFELHKGEWSLYISDCNRPVHIHGRLTRMDERGNSLYKLHKLRDTIDELIAHVENDIEVNKLKVKRYE